MKLQEREKLITALRNAALPDPHDEREVMHAPLLREAADEIVFMQGMLNKAEPVARIMRKPFPGGFSLAWIRADDPGENDFGKFLYTTPPPRPQCAEKDRRIAELENIAYSDDGAGGEGMKLYLDNQAMKKRIAELEAALLASAKTTEDAVQDLEKVLTK